MAAAYVFMILAGIAFLFQIALAVGAPWGHLTWGGKFPGRLPSRMRGVAVVSAGLLLVFMVTIALRAHLLLPGWLLISRYAVWCVVAYCVLGVAANASTKSRWERIIWLPVVTGMLLSSVVVALS